MTKVYVKILHTVVYHSPTKPVLVTCYEVTIQTVPQKHCYYCPFSILAAAFVDTDFLGYDKIVK